MESLPTLIARVQAALDQAKAEVGPYAADNITGWHKRHRERMDQLAGTLRAEIGAKITSRWDGCAVKIGGIRSTSTGGMSGALQNWLRAARGKAGRS